MENHRLDFHSTFRILSSFKASAIPSEVEDFINRLLAVTPESERLDVDTAKKEWIRWFDVYKQRIQGEHEEAAALGWSLDFSEMESERQKSMKSANPRFVLRQWVLEEVIKRVERDSDSGKRVLAKVMHVSGSSPL